MSQPPVPVDPVATALVQARQQLAQTQLAPFSQEGFNKLLEQVGQYIGDLLVESARIMKRRQADTVSPAYVQQASENLVASTRRRLFTFAGTIGGALLGAG